MSLKVAIGQLCSTSSLSINARVVKKLIHKAIEAKAEVLFLPEATDYISRDANHSMALANSTPKEFISVIQAELQKIYNGSDKEGLFVAIGVHEPSQSKSEGSKTELKKVQNNQIWIDNKGEILHRYQKLHLFDINITNGPILKESNSVEPGKEVEPPFPVTAGSKFNVGFAICYDIRFPELALRLRKLGANIITFPSAFTTKTGEVHWQALGRARAIDSQCFVVMAAQCGEHNVYADLSEEERLKLPETDQNKKRISYGNSIIFDPWGKILTQCKTYDDDLSGDIDSDGDYYEIAFADLDIDSLENVRKNMPLMDHRRPDVFGYEV